MESGKVTEVFVCPLGHGKDNLLFYPDEEALTSAWCRDCRHAKEGLCDYPHSIGRCQMIVYQGINQNEVYRIENGDPLKLDPAASRAVYDHSVDFSWSYNGSGPAQLSLALLLDVTGEEEVALRLHQRFKELFVASWGPSFVINSSEILEWVKKSDREAKA